MRFLSAFILSLVVVSNAGAQEIVHATAMSPINLSEVRSTSESVSEEHEIPRHVRTPLAIWLAGPVSPESLAQGAIPTIAAPPVTATFQTNIEKDLLPADAAGAVGRNHVVGLTNQGITIHNRAGQQLLAVSVAAFMAAPPGDTSDYYDSRMVYDAVNDRWVVICLRASGIELVIAVSQTGDPTGTWNRYRLPYSAFSTARIDFSHIALTRDTIVFGTLDGGFQAVLVSMNKADLYAGGASPALKVYRFNDPYDRIPVTNEESGIEYVTTAYFISRLDRSASITIQQPCACSFPFKAPQMNASASNGVDPGPGDVEAAVYRNGAVYVVRTVAISSDSIQWMKFNPETGMLLDSGLIDDPTGQTFYLYPSLAVNSAGEMIIGFTTVGPNKFLSAGYLYRDAAGRVSTIGSIKNGDSTYLRGPSTFGQRWGDYTTTVVDPMSDHTFWTIQIIAQSTHWAAWWAKIETPAARRRAVKR